MKKSFLKKVDGIGEPETTQAGQGPNTNIGGGEMNLGNGKQDRGNGGQDKMGTWRAVGKDYCLWLVPIFSVFGFPKLQPHPSST